MIAASESRLHRPANLRFDESIDAGDYVASMPPNRLPALPLLFFCMFWDGFLYVWYSNALSHRVWLMIVFPLLHVGVGVAITHNALVSLLNTRTFRIAGGRVTYRSGPIPFAGKLDVRIDEIDSFTIEQKSAESTSYALVANLEGGVQKKLDVVTNDRDGTSYIATSLNDALERARAGKPAALSAYRG